MADTKPETVEPDPAATSLPNDEPVNKSGEDSVPAGDSKDAPADDGAAKDIKVETEGNAVESTTENGEKSEAAATTEKAAEKSSDSGEKRKREDTNKYRTYNNKHVGTKFDPSTQEETDDPIAIRKQVEFYFSDSNLARDKFLFDKVKGTKNEPIDIKVIHSFKRMRRFQPYDAVVKALKESDFLEVTENEQVKRKEALPADFENKTLEEITKVVENESMARSVYVKGFGLEKPSTQFDLEAWFSQFGGTNAVRLRRADDQSFKGSVFVEFDNEETAQKFLKQDPAPAYAGRDLLVRSKKEYCDDKVQQIRDGKLQPNGKAHDRKGDDNRDWRERRDDDRKRGFRDDKRGGRGRGRGRGGRGRGRGGSDRRDRRDRDDRDGRGDGEENKKRSRDEQGDGERASKKEKLDADAKAE